METHRVYSSYSIKSTPQPKLTMEPGRVRRRQPPPGISRQDSDDELGIEDHPWQWIYEDGDGGGGGGDVDGDDDHAEQDNGQPRCRSARKKRPAPCERRVVGARMGTFECRLGDTVLLKAEGSNEAWVAIICDFIEEDQDGEMAANFMWFSTEKEIRNRKKKRTDFYWNELYISPSWDINPLTSINGKANVMSMKAFLERYPSGKIPRNSHDFGRTFVCQRGANTRTATYTDEFVWEDIYRRREGDMNSLVDLITRETKAARKPRTARKQKQEEEDYGQGDHDGGKDKSGRDCSMEDAEDEGEFEIGDGSLRERTDGTRTPKKARVSKQRQPKLTTPSHKRITVKKALQITPLAMRALSPARHQASPFHLARTKLHVAAVPDSLPCREEEFAQVYGHLEAAITEASGACIYISGTPGTGKTATVREVVAALNAAVQSEELDDFIFVEINGMKITDPYQSYSHLWEALKDQRVSPAQALDLLEREFDNPSPRRIPCVVLMDELDQLVTKNQSVMYNFFNWPGLRHSRLIVLAVANTMDLPERTLSNKISSRLGLTRLQFPGYNHEQLMKIIHSRLEGVPGNIVEPDAVQFASRKVAAVSGDARRALDICRRAVEIAEEAANSGEASSTPSQKGTPPRADGGKKGRVTIATVKKAINEATTSPLQQYLRALPFASKIVLVAFLARVRRTGIAESTYGEVLDELHKASKLADGPITFLVPPQKGGAKTRLTAVGRTSMDLQEAGILVLEGHKLDRPSKVRLGISADEIRLAFRDDPEVIGTRIAY
ncbi:P-loop containing nucleoside triphosphate hydrolase protein [Zalerion maritima]|uniref:Origin recognition complex subunit 1 n=1 Tax=Zalerion maritima TaxID=339359 RepID=A0AAD5WQY5_9PEZI|nr:P-loop containing nucleoside triphosphate hydrolase protein [Zalerion maritima]